MAKPSPKEDWFTLRFVELTPYKKNRANRAF